MIIAELPIHIDPALMDDFCRVRGIRQLRLFGSVLRNDFNPDRSDIDVLVEYLPGRHPGLNHFLYQEELTELLHRRVDLNTPPMLSEHIREDVGKETLLLYEQT